MSPERRRDTKINTTEKKIVNQLQLLLQLLSFLFKFFFLERYLSLTERCSSGAKEEELRGRGESKYNIRMERAVCET